MNTGPRVVNIRHEKCDVYVGRGSMWGNPFTHIFTGRRGTIVVATREEAIKRYEEYLLGSPALIEALPTLRGKVLGCYCHPKPCHAATLLKYANA